jgi:hypothetical protein
MRIAHKMLDPALLRYKYIEISDPPRRLFGGLSAMHM